jgi:hypothetical protein
MVARILKARRPWVMIGVSQRMRMAKRKRGFLMRP